MIITITLVGNNGDAFLSLKRNISIISKGVLDNDEVERSIIDAHFLLCPSTLDNSPNVVTESLSLSTPAIVRSETGAATYILDGESGYVVDFSNLSSDYIFDVHEKLANTDLHLMQQNAKSICDAKYSMESIGLTYKSNYERLLK